MKFSEALDRFLEILRRLRFYEIMLFIFLAIILGAWSIKEITETALFCGNTCHVMRPHYRDWETSSHKEVQCVKCHIPPDEQQQFVPRFRALTQVAGYMTRSHGDGQRAEVSDSSCLVTDCHSRRLLDGRVTFRQGIVFDHSPHLRQLRRGKILRCTTCHSQVTMGEHITVTMDTCFICHFKDRGSNPETSNCRLCHSEIDTRFTHEPYLARGADCDGCHAGVTSGNGEIIRDSCHQCHNEPGPETEERSAEVLHRLHITDHKVECAECHAPIRHSMPAPSQETLTGCDTCHENRHAGISLLYAGRGAEGVPDLPSAMFEYNVACQACHLVPDVPGGVKAEHQGSSMLAIDAACDKCHDKGAADVLHTLGRELEKELVKSERLLAQSQALVADTSREAIQPELKRVISTAQHNILFIRASTPIHNPEYAIRVLDYSSRELKRAMKSIEQR
jgi:nitrate/TMAO reductase-like tetraheme cytochrome c subunit